jgi:hypothetical protein
MTDLPAVPPPGTSAVFPLPTLAASGGAPNLSGLIVAADGRLTVAHRGAGLAVRLAPEDCSALAILLWQLAGQLAGQRQIAADAADNALDRIVKERATNA